MLVAQLCEVKQHLLVPGWVTVSSCIFSYLVYNLVGAFLGLAIMLRGESLSARVEKKRKNVSDLCRMCRNVFKHILYEGRRKKHKIKREHFMIFLPMKKYIDPTLPYIPRLTTQTYL